MKISGKSWKDSHSSLLPKTFLLTGFTGIFLLSNVFQTSAKGIGEKSKMNHIFFSNGITSLHRDFFNRKANAELTAGVNVSKATTIRGKVTDEKNQPLPGVSIRVKGSKQAVSTNNEGEFQLITAEEQPTLILTFIGYKTQEVIFNGQPLAIKPDPDQSN